MKHTNGNGAGADDLQGDAVKRSYNTLVKLHRTAKLAGDADACVALQREAHPWTFPAYFFRFDAGEVRLRRGCEIRTGGDLDDIEFHVAVKMADEVQCKQWIQEAIDAYDRAGRFDELEKVALELDRRPASGRLERQLHPHHGLDAAKIVKVEPGCFSNWLAFDLRRLDSPARARYHNGLHTLNATYWQEQVDRAREVLQERERIAEATRRRQRARDEVRREVHIEVAAELQEIANAEPTKAGREVVGRIAARLLDQ